MTGRAVDPAKADPHKVAMSRQDNRARLAGIVQDRVPRPDRGAIGKAGLTVAQDNGPAAVAKVAYGPVLQCHPVDPRSRKAPPCHDVEIADRVVQKPRPDRLFAREVQEIARVQNMVRPAVQPQGHPRPDSRISVRSMPGKAENAPPSAMVAMDSRQAKSSNPAPGGKAAISRVSPPPFFQGVAVRR